jgi:hypothetical protein
MLLLFLLLLLSFLFLLSLDDDHWVRSTFLGYGFVTGWKAIKHNIRLDVLRMKKIIYRKMVKSQLDCWWEKKCSSIVDLFHFVNDQLIHSNKTFTQTYPVYLWSLGFSIRHISVWLGFFYVYWKEETRKSYIICVLLYLDSDL